MRNSLRVAILVAFGVTVAVPATAAEKKAAPSEQQTQEKGGKDVTKGKPAQSETSRQKPGPSETGGKNRPDQK